MLFTWQMAVLSRHRLPIGLVGLCVVFYVSCFYVVSWCSLSLLRLFLWVSVLCFLHGCFGILLWVLQPSVVGDPLLSILSNLECVNLFRFTEKDIIFSK